MFLFFSIASCTLTSKKDKEVVEYDGPYFHARSYFEAERERLIAEDYTFEKKVTLNGKSEALTLDSLDLKKEFSIFFKNDINRPAYDGRYQVDSLLGTQQKLTQLSYTALDDKLAVRLLNLYFDEKQNIEKIEMTTTADSKLMGVNSTVIYEPQKGYRMNNNQKIILFGEQDMEVEVAFLK